jgi:hypothetical protein
MVHKGNVMKKKIVILAFVFSFLVVNIYSQENNEGNFFQRHFNNRIYLGYYSSYFDDNIQVLQAGYDAVLNLIDITPNFNLLDVGIGLNGLLAYDMVNEVQKDNFGHERPKNGRITVGFELDWSVRMYIIPIPKINSRIFVDFRGITLVVYSREFPDTGTNGNIGTHIGLGMEYPINKYKAYTMLKWFHTSNGDVYENNPALNAVGIVTGLQF